jgi:hypothetical protein
MPLVTGLARSGRRTARILPAVTPRIISSFSLQLRPTLAHALTAVERLFSNDDYPAGG